MRVASLTACAALVGLDWADRQHEIWLQGAGSDPRACSVLPHRPERMAQWAPGLRQRFDGRPLAVCLELRQGPLIDALPPDDCLVRFAVHPTTLTQSRQAFCLS